MTEKSGKKRKPAFLLLAACLFFALAAGSSSAAMKDTSQKLTNSFSAAVVETEVKEPPVTVNKTSITKMPVVKNTGKSDCIIRVRVTVSPAEYLHRMEIDFHVNGWKLEEDGFYYYQEIVKPGMSTVPLFTTIKGLTDEEGKAADWVEDFQITLYQEAVQTEIHNEGESVWKAFDEEGRYRHADAMKIWSFYDIGEK